MRNVLFALVLLLSGTATAQNSNEVISDSIRAGLAALLYDSVPETHNVFWKGGIEYVYLSQIAGGQFRAISSTNRPDVFKFNDATLVRAWHVYEIDTWLSGTFDTNYEGYVCSDAGILRTCTITISGDDWTGTSTDDWDAMGRAFYALLFDPDFATYLP
jgi:hypothetical protein